jgi:monoamine oxidase
VVSWVGGIDQERFTLPGGLGRISLALEDAVNKAAAGRMHKGATVLHVEQKESKVLVSYSESGELKTITAKTAIIACPKFIAKRIIKGLDQEHFDAMTAMRYQPYLVVNVCSNQVIYNGSFDTNIPAPSMIVDFNVADWVINRDNKEINRPAILTCYVPRPLEERSRALHDDYCIQIGEKVVNQLDTWFPGAKKKVEEVHIYRRGHPMYVSAPGVLTRLAPAIRKPQGNLFFAHSDSEGGVTDYSSAHDAAERTSREVISALGKHAARSSTAVAG